MEFLDPKEAVKQKEKCIQIWWTSSTKGSRHSGYISLNPKRHQGQTCMDTHTQGHTHRLSIIIKIFSFEKVWANNRVPIHSIIITVSCDILAVHNSTTKRLYKTQTLDSADKMHFLDLDILILDIVASQLSKGHIEHFLSHTTFYQGKVS